MHRIACLLKEKKQLKWLGMQKGDLDSTKFFACGLIPFTYKFETPWRPEAYTWEFGTMDTYTELFWDFFHTLPRFHKIYIRVLTLSEAKG